MLMFVSATTSLLIAYGLPRSHTRRGEHLGTTAALAAYTLMLGMDVMYGIKYGLETTFWSVDLFFIISHVASLFLVSQLWGLAITSQPSYTNLRDYSAASSWGQALGSVSGMMISQIWKEDEIKIRWISVLLATLLSLITTIMCYLQEEEEEEEQQHQPQNGENIKSFINNESVFDNDTDLIITTTTNNNPNKIISAATTTITSTNHNTTIHDNDKRIMSPTSRDFTYVMLVTLFQFLYSLFTSLVMMLRLETITSPSSVAILQTQTSMAILLIHTIPYRLSSHANLLLLPIVCGLMPGLFMLMEWNHCTWQHRQVLVSIMTIMGRTTSYAVSKPSREALFAGMTKEERRVSKPLVDNFISRVGSASASLLHAYWHPDGLFMFIGGLLWLIHTHFMYERYRMRINLLSDSTLSNGNNQQLLISRTKKKQL
jgi:hypothetical protein